MPPLPPREDEVVGEMTEVEVVRGLLKASNALVVKLQSSIEERDQQCVGIRSELERLKAMHDPSDAAGVTELERLRSDLRRVREAVAKNIQCADEFDRVAVTTDGVPISIASKALLDSDACVREINKEPMP